MAKALLLGIIASFFFAFTFIFNHQMNISGGSWLWSSSLRYLFMLPILFVIMIVKKQLKDVLKDILRNPVPWFVWSTVGFGLFYAPITYASVFGESWLVAATWQVTIVAGALLTPFFYQYIETQSGTSRIRNKIPRKSLLWSVIIIVPSNSCNQT